jgi:hypothetical protein
MGVPAEHSNAKPAHFHATCRVDVAAAQHSFHGNRMDRT